jgi:hypothetical protein
VSTIDTRLGLRARRDAVAVLLRFTVALAGYTAGAVFFRYGLGWHRRPGLLTVVLATVLVAWALGLLAERLSRAADRIVYGSHAPGQQAVRGLLQRIASTVPVDEVLPRLAEAAGRTLGGPRAEVRLKLADGAQWSQVWPPGARTAVSSITAGVSHGGAAVGEIEVGMDAALDSPSERRLLDELAAPAGLALSTVRLTFELRHRIDELDRVNTSLRASSQRMLTAERGEQRRLEREVNDHVLGHVSAVETAMVALRVVVQPRSLGEAQDGCQLALGELRTIARGIFPPRLSEAGLLVSIEGWLDRARLPADVSASNGLGHLHEQVDLETCLYFCCVTALDALAAAGRTALSVHLEESATDVVVRMSGRGPRSLNHNAMAVVRDRIEAFDGVFTMTQPDSFAPEVIVCRAPMPPSSPVNSAARARDSS